MKSFLQRGLVLSLRYVLHVGRSKKEEKEEESVFQMFSMFDTYVWKEEIQFSRFSVD
jgi:hypothetical protein